MKGIAIALMLASFVLLSTITDGIAGNPITITTDSYFACVSKDTFSKAVDMVRDNDRAAFAKLLLTGACIHLQRGSQVYLEDISVFSGTAQIRPQGKVSSYWTFYEAVKGK